MQSSLLQFIFLLPIILPLVSYLLIGLAQHKINFFTVKLIALGSLITSAIISVIIWFYIQNNGFFETQLFNWISTENLRINWSITYDSLSALMLVVVTGVSSLVHIYSSYYMKNDPENKRFLAYLGLFTFMMLMLVTASNFLQLFLGWEGVGLASYLLIGFWNKKASANDAAIKAFVVNRVGDLGLVIAMAFYYIAFKTLSFEPLSNLPAHIGNDASIVSYFDIIVLCCVIGAMGKSAQFGLHVWLPDAMEGPTPVSALIHAATMVTAGVFLLSRVSPMIEYTPEMATFITILGAITALFAATTALGQNDIKRVIAYSTCSQLGYMVLAIGVGAYSAAMYHLFTHAFFKALLFLGAGAVIHSLHHEQDIRKMGNLRRYMPISHILMLIGSLALAGIPPFAGFFSKDLILESAYASHNSVGLFAYIVGVCVALITALYSFKIFLMAFWGKKNNNQVNIKEGSNYMIIPMAVLAVGAVLLGYLTKDIFGGDQTRITYWSNIIAGNLNDVIHHAHHVPLYIKLLPLIAGILGIIIAIILYADYSYDEIKDTNRTSNPLYKFVANRWYIDHLYNTIIVKPFIIIARIASDIVDKFIIDGLTTRLPVYNARINAKILVYIQNGQVNNYIIATLFGFAMILLITLF